ncbi:MAG: efflux RND transporter periplasmic adaptor subunit [Rubrivivax sp.]|nr:efflux RND transporter periplasmic adaptor subunit [Rubrivivax sp.]
MTDNKTSPDLDELLGPPPPRRRALRWALAAIALALLAGGLLAWRGAQQQAAAPRYDTQPVSRGALTVKVSATGTLQPTQQADIGSELSGTVATVHADVNDRVQRGQVLAALDTARLQDTVAASRAALASTRATLQQAEATLAETRASLARLEQVFQASGGQVPSGSEMDTARAALARADAAVANARAGIAQAEANQRADETNLRKATIRSPIAGVVLARSVDPGNAVAASLQAVTLFTIAEDLTKMKLQVNVDEADVGQVQAGQRAEFSVSAWPTRRYPATLTRVSYGATTQDNVITYLADLTVDNADLSLRPGMTATASIVTVQRSDALLVPSAALRYSPEQVAAPASGGGTSIVSRLMPRPPGGGGNRRTAVTDTAQVRQVWVLQDGQPVAVPVTPGASDGRFTEVSSATLQPGALVITGQAAAPK